MKNIHVLPTDKPSRFWMTRLGNLTRCHDIKPIKKALGNNVNIYITSDEEIKDVRPHKGKWQLEQGQILNKFPSYLTDLSECKLVIMTTDQDLIKNGVQAIDDEFLEWFVKNPSCEKIEFQETYPPACCIQKEGKTKMNSGCMERNRCLNYKIIIPKEEPTKTHHLDELPNIDKDILTKMWEDTIPKVEPKREVFLMNAHGVLDTREPKQETLEEAAENYGWRIKTNSFSDRVKANELAESAKQDFIFGAKWQQERMYSEEEVEQMINSFEKLCYNYQSNKDWFPSKKSEWFKQYKKK